MCVSERDVGREAAAAAAAAAVARGEVLPRLSGIPLFLEARKGETKSAQPEGLRSLRILRTHPSAASSDGCRGGSVFKA